MLTISKSLSGGQARMYHAREFKSEQANYWSKDQQGHSEWQGKLAQQWGLEGSVGAEHFARLTEGQHPTTEEQLVRHQPAKTYENQFGREVTSVEHRAGWDATFSAPKSVSLTTLVGGDDRVREAHRESVRIALGELERYTQARIGNIQAPELTGKFAAATFEHDTARPVDGYAAPQLHTHAVIFNVTERENSQTGELKTGALQERGLFQSQQFATTVYRTELAARLQDLGYEIERGKHGQPEIKGYTQEYLEASSPRRGQIEKHLQAIGREGAGAAQVAAHRTRDSKELQSPAEVLHRHRELAAQHGHQADWVVTRALSNHQRQEIDSPKVAQQAVTYARDHVFEKSSVQDERSIMTAAMNRSMGQASSSRVREEFDRRVAQGEFRTVENAPASAGQQYTTAAMLRMERETIAQMQAGNKFDANQPALVEARTSARTIEQNPMLNPSQQLAAEQIFASREKIVGLDGMAGVGKTTTLAVIREGVEANGYRIEGFAPTSGAAARLAEAGIETSTLQMHLAKGQRADNGEKTLYVVDESSLASSKQMHDFVTRLHPNDRVLLVGDTRQHEAVEAGRPFAQLQEAGMFTVKLSEIVRQRDPELRNVVEQLARGEVREAVEGLGRQGRVHEVKDPSQRIEAIAKEYARSPESTLVVSPDNRSRAEINAKIHTELQTRGIVGKEEYKVGTLVPRQDLTGADRTWAQRYEPDNVLLYSRSSKDTGIKKGEYARVKHVDAEKNLLTVVRFDGSERTYDPRRQQGVSVYRDQEKAFSVGDRLQFTAPAKSVDLKVANRELATIESITDDGRMQLKMDRGGHRVSFDPRDHPHVDHGYAVTSHSSQGQTADRVLIHVDTELGAKDLLNNRMAYVAVSRGARDAQIFTNDREKLPQALGRDVSQQSAHVTQEVKQVEKGISREEHERHWATLNKALSPDEARQFAWRIETGTIQTYQHLVTQRVLHIDGTNGQFYRQDGNPITAKQALDHAMPGGERHSHSLELNQRPEMPEIDRSTGHGHRMGR
ncbi:conjugative relaxase-like TrwC/TraI family protein [Granulicella aggregans]|uniref:Conjugative relaxase-like TrwC/TraI family protein n=1 Tax=Granulicella aggregans TaxID=474949 RepID=A0A7W8E6V5_9BACT|nr:conjugative relaxase-like TrwC/TraI family protein [Granulicella aggregans]